MLVRMHRIGLRLMQPGAAWLSVPARVFPLPEPAMKVYDCSVTLREGMAIYPGDPGYEREIVSSVEQGDSATNSVLHMGVHTGTHVDGLAHMMRNAPSVDQVPLDTLVGPARVVQVDTDEAITAEDLRTRDWSGVERVLFKTPNSGKLEQLDEFVEDFIHLDGSAGRFLADLGTIRLVAVDYLSVDKLHSGNHPAHTALMDQRITIVEGVDLSEVPPGDYLVVCGALKIQGGDGAPARVLLLERD
jgi:arylformamidase